MAEIISVNYTSADGSIFPFQMEKLIRIKTANFHNWTYNPQTVAQRFGVRVVQFGKSPAAYQTRLYFSGAIADRKTRIDAFHLRAEADLRNNTPGRLSWGDYYVNCFIRSSSTYPENDYTANDVEIYAPFPFWIQENSMSFSAQETEAEYVQAMSDTFSDVTNRVQTYSVSASGSVMDLMGLPVGTLLKVEINGSSSSDGTYEIALGQSIGSLQARKTSNGLTITDGVFYLNFAYQSAVSMIQRNIADYGTVGNENIKVTIWYDTRGASGTYLDYPFDYAYDYYKGVSGSSNWIRSHPYSSDFRMVIYGATSEPAVYINGHRYRLNYEIDPHACAVIDSRAHTITLVQQDGGTTNLFDFRDKTSDIFAQIPAGNLSLIWGNFAFDLTIYEERSEPTW